MTTMFLFLFLFASQLFLVTPLVITGEQVENKEEPLSSEVKKTMNNIERREEVEKREETPPCKVNRTALEPTHSKTLETPQEHGDILPEKVKQEFDSCRRVKMVVNFADLGLSDTIIAPPFFDAYKCIGKCSPIQKKTILNRSLLLDMLEKKKGIKIEGKACCVPTKLKPISVLYIDEGNQVVLRTFEDMVVEECGCNNK